jgi:thioredoxin reductase (NADPH)
LSNSNYTLVIIGGGPIGLAAALEAQKADIDYVVLEKGALVNSLFNYPVNMSFFSTSERLEIGEIPFVSNNAKPTRAEALEYYRRVVIAKKLNVHLFEEVKEINKKSAAAGFEIITQKQNYSCRYMIIATGFYDIPFLLDVPGEYLPKVTHYYKDPHFYAFQDVLVVGASNSAVDAALETWRKGARVTMIIRGEQVGERVKYWVRPDIINRIQEGSIKAYFHSTVKEIREKEVVIITPEGELTLPNDWVIAMTGYQPNLEFLRKLGITLSNDEIKKPMYSEDSYETNIPGIFLAGVICGGMNTSRLFIENSREHAVKVVRAIVAREKQGIK